MSWSPARLSATATDNGGSIHGQNSCFLPLRQLDQDYYAPRIVQIAGAYPGLTKEEFYGVQSEEAAEVGQWSYDFSDPEGPQVGTVAMDGSELVSFCPDPVAIIAEHSSVGVDLPKEITEPVDLIVLVDRSRKGFSERTFLVVDTPEEGVLIRAYGAKVEIPDGSEILGQVLLVQIPWLPSMAPTKTGFMEADEYFGA
ncbi:predicted protein [Phaeodactylum tricornutum CCAP 1055/1]|jgi:hypothetical protein|uniref:Rubisco accumulation factor 1 C-terminal domain-containing protein n=2 Tax=Phaeodactylum tricornutum TaxID=2850 RepID=B7FTB2_PHATC|nr:predicted protein [Phaeodactylum tricornutum CCAP 1055/1]EEC50938.1 predicted protein [Phaeodactylum tricornutum CCAP 1055/1]|eukprot:XP_002178124.1 predicted protein [Phaeodactylum tricornutum CCAP 1055/1]